MTAYVVRRLASERTHVAREGEAETYSTKIFGVPYTRIDGQAACGVKIDDGVIMQPGTRVRCRACRHITGVEEAA